MRRHTRSIHCTLCVRARVYVEQISTFSRRSVCSEFEKTSSCWRWLQSVTRTLICCGVNTKRWIKSPSSCSTLLLLSVV